MKKVICTLMGIAVAIFVFCGLGTLGNEEFLNAVNSESATEAYKHFVSSGYIGNGQRYTLTPYAYDNNGICMTYRLDVKDSVRGESTYFYCVSNA